MRQELVELKSSKIENEKNLMDKNVHLNSQLKKVDENMHTLNVRLNSYEEQVNLKQKQIEDLYSEINHLQQRVKSDEIKLSHYEYNSNDYVKQISSLNDNLSNTISQRDGLERELKDFKLGVQLQSEDTQNAHKKEIDQLTQNMTQKYEQEIKSLKEKLSNTEIDLNSLRDKLSESLKDYRASIDKLKQENALRYQKIKKKLVNCQLVLNMVEKNLLAEGSDTPATLLSQFLSTRLETKSNKLEQAANSANLDQTEINPSKSVDETDPVNFEFDESKFKEFFEQKRAELEKLRSCSSYENQVESLNETLKQLKGELEATKEKLERAETNLRVRLL